MPARSAAARVEPQPEVPADFKPDKYGVIKGVTGERIDVARAEWDVLEKTYRDAEAKLEAAKAEALAAERAIKARMEGRTDLYVDGELVVTWRPVVSKRFDVTRFRRENEGIYQVYLVDSITRRFLVIDKTQS